MPQLVPFLNITNPVNQFGIRNSLSLHTPILGNLSRHFSTSSSLNKTINSSILESSYKATAKINSNDKNNYNKNINNETKNLDDILESSRYLRSDEGTSKTLQQQKSPDTTNLDDNYEYVSYYCEQENSELVHTPKAIEKHGILIESKKENGNIVEYDQLYDYISTLLNKILHNNSDNLTDILFLLAFVLALLLLIILLKLGVIKYITEIIINSYRKFLLKSSSLYLKAILNAKKIKYCIDIANEIRSYKDSIKLIIDYYKKIRSNKLIKSRTNNLSFNSSILSHIYYSKNIPVFMLRNVHNTVYLYMEDRYEASSPIRIIIYPVINPYSTYHVRIFRYLLDLRTNYRWNQDYNYIIGVLSRNSKAIVEGNSLYRSINNNISNDMLQVLEDFDRDRYISLDIYNMTLRRNIDVKDWKVYESEVSFAVKQILHHYFNSTELQKDTWFIKDQHRTGNRAIPDYTISGLYSNNLVTKVVVECKTYDGDSFNQAINQTEWSALTLLGQGGDYTNEFEDNQVLFSAPSAFVIIVKGTKIAFLERYSYDLDFTPSNKNVVPLTLQVDRTNGIESRNLQDIMNRYYDRFSRDHLFPFIHDAGDIAPINLRGDYYVLDLIDDAHVVHELFVYVSTNLPRVHEIR